MRAARRSRSRSPIRAIGRSRSARTTISSRPIRAQVRPQESPRHAARHRGRHRGALRAGTNPRRATGRPRRQARRLRLSRRRAGETVSEAVSAMDSQRVVPANAGTPARAQSALVAAARILVSVRRQRPFFIFDVRGYGSLRSQGRPTESVCQVLATSTPPYAITLPRKGGGNMPADGAK